MNDSDLYYIMPDGKLDGRPGPPEQMDCKPVSRARIDIIYELTKTATAETLKKYEAGEKDDWLEKGFGELFDSLKYNIDDVEKNLFAIDHDEKNISSIEKAKAACAHSIICLAMIHDKLNHFEKENR